MSPMATGNTFEDDGSYNAAGGDLGGLQTKPKASLMLDPKSIRGLEDYRPGDRIKAEVEFMWPKDGEVGEDGMIEADVISVKPEDMEPGAKAKRGMEPKEGAPDLMME